jgi:serine/threonine protein kinase
MEEGNIIVGGKYRIIRKVGSGSFGTVYLGENQATGDDVAVKVESHNSEPQQLLYEARILRELQGGLGIPVLYWSGVVGNYNVMVLELLGPCLETLLSQCHHKFSMKTVCQLASQMLKRLEYVHEQSFVHRDMKPENFLIGTSKKTSIVHIIDFGLSKKYRDGKTHQHIPYREGKSLTGTARYVSVNSHLGLELSRRDDVESLGYIIVYFFKGALPWQGTRGNTKQEKYNKILEKKMAVPPHVLCKGCPDVFATFLTYCKGLQFEERPDYTYATNLFVELGIKQGFTFDRVFDWTEVLVGTHGNERPGKSMGSSHNGKKQKVSASLKNRRKSEIISKDTMKELIRKKTISEHGSDSQNESSVATFVNKDCGPFLKAKTRLALNGLNSAEKAKFEEKKGSCALF